MDNRTQQLLKYFQRKADKLPADVVTVEEFCKSIKSSQLNVADLDFPQEVQKIVDDLDAEEQSKIDGDAFEEKPNYQTQDKVDKNDRNQFNWAGIRSTGELFEHAMKPTPMFFRRDGMNVDLINIYKGSNVFLICNGPSFKDVNHDLLRKPGIVTFGVNNGGHVFRPNLWSCVDDPTRFMPSIWNDPTIMKFVPQAHFEKPLFDPKTNKIIDRMVGDCPNVFGYRRNEHLIPEQYLFENTINWGNHKDHGGGRSIMISTMKICYLLGFKNVFLVGCDFDMSNKKKYFFDEDRSKSAINNNRNSYDLMNKYFSQLDNQFRKVGFNVFNVTEGSKLESFRTKSLKDAINESLIDTSDSTKGMYKSPSDKEKISNKK